MQQPDNPPPGFRRMPPVGTIGSSSPNIALYLRGDGERLTAGFRVRPEHLNPAGMCHGGTIATFCDVVLAISATYAQQMGPNGLLTVNLSISYLGPTHQGAWMEASGEVLRTTRSLLFAQALVRADGEPVARTDGVFKIVPLKAHGVSTGVWLHELLDRPDSETPHDDIRS